MLLADHAALQPGMHSDQFGRLGQNLLMDSLGLAQGVAGRFELPSSNRTLPGRV
jgi:hypothetical protein